jgi:hypothetical protein
MCRFSDAGNVIYAHARMPGVRAAHTQHPEKNCTRRRNELIAKGAMNTGE